MDGLIHKKEKMLVNTAKCHVSNVQKEWNYSVIFFC